MTLLTSRVSDKSDSEDNNRITSEAVDEKIRANFETLNEQISNITELLQLIIGTSGNHNEVSRIIITFQTGVAFVCIIFFRKYAMQNDELSFEPFTQENLN